MSCLDTQLPLMMIGRSVKGTGPWNQLTNSKFRNEHGWQLKHIGTNHWFSIKLCLITCALAADLLFGMKWQTVLMLIILIIDTHSYKERKIKQEGKCVFNLSQGEKSTAQHNTTQHNWSSSTLCYWYREMLSHGWKIT